MNQWSYITFPSTYYAIRAEKALSGKEWEFKMVPVPRSISSSCGTALRCHPEHLSPIGEYLESCSVRMEKMYTLEEEKGPSLLSLFSKKRKKDE